jgi:very-short-patch-repair endonuclease
MRSLEHGIAEVATRQHGSVSRPQLLALGLSPAAISRRLLAGRLIRLHTGVYAVGDLALPPGGRIMAAILATGDGAVASHRTAAMIWGILKWLGWPEVTSPGRRRPRPGLIPHTSPLLADEVTIRNGVPLTTPSRTLLDLASVLDLAELRRAINEAHAQRLRLAPSLPELVERHPRRRGAANLRLLLAEDQVGLGITKREFEAAFFEFLTEEGFPAPLINHPVAVGSDVFTVDFAWPRARLIVETDGDAFHSTPQRRARDKRNDRRLRSIGWSVIRVAWAHLIHDRAEPAADLQAALLSPPNDSDPPERVAVGSCSPSRG